MVDRNRRTEEAEEILSRREFLIKSALIGVAATGLVATSESACVCLEESLDCESFLLHDLTPGVEAWWRASTTNHDDVRDEADVVEDTSPDEPADVVEDTHSGDGEDVREEGADDVSDEPSGGDHSGFQIEVRIRRTDSNAGYLAFNPPTLEGAVLLDHSYDNAENLTFSCDPDDGVTRIEVTIPTSPCQAQVFFQLDVSGVPRADEPISILSLEMREV